MRKLAFVLLTFISSMCLAQYPALAVDSAITVRHDTAVVIHYDTVVTIVRDTVVGFDYDGQLILVRRNHPIMFSDKNLNPRIPEDLGLGSDAESSKDSTGLMSKVNRRLHRVDREIEQLVFIPKKTITGGVSVSYSELNFDDINMLLAKNIDANGYQFGVSGHGGYFVRDNMAVGLRLSYNRSFLDLRNFDLNLGEDFNIALKDYYYLEHDFLTTAYMRTYMPLGRSKIFGFFSEMQLTYGYGQCKSSTGKYEDGNLEASFSTMNKLSIGFAPGLTAFVRDWMAVEVQLGVLGFNFKWVDQTTNQVQHAKQRTCSGKFKIDLFSIAIGTTIYI